MLYVVVLCSAASLIAYEAWGNSVGYSHTVEKITTNLQLENNLKTSGKKILEKITFSLYDGYSESMEELKELKVKAQQYNKNAFRLTKAFIGIVLLSVVIFFIGRQKALLGGMIGLSIIALVTGWFATILEITAYQELPMLGNTIFQYESKSIVTALIQMFDKQQFMIAGIIVLFTVVTPILKTILLILINMQQKLHLSKKRIKFLSTIGKWSMLDVFVVAIVVTYFSMKASGKTDADLQIGVYYFSIYVILSMVCTYVVSFKRN